VEIAPLETAETAEAPSEIPVQIGGGKRKRKRH
jgi:hypothetical protein